jgi:hypothetical protein
LRRACCFAVETLQVEGASSETTTVIGRGRLDLRRILQRFLGFEVVACLQAGLLAFDPIGSFLDHGVQFAGVPGEEAVGVAFFAGG